MKRIFLLCMRLVAVGGIVLMGSMLEAQVANNTSLVGAVVDQSGAPVVGAKVTAVNEDTHVTYPGGTNAEGYYSITFIAPPASSGPNPPAPPAMPRRRTSDGAWRSAAGSAPARPACRRRSP